MKPKDFEGADIVFGENQPEYMPLPAKRGDWPKGGEIHTCWELSPEELQEIQKTGVIWLSILTFRQPLQPVRLSTEKPF